jgi:ATP-binding cassette, subfamily B, bacterial HlyB/CyaB
VTTPASEEPLRTALRGQPYFAALGDEGVRRLATAATTVPVPMGETVAREGEPCDGVLFIVSGRLRLVRQGRSGKTVTLGTLGAGEVLGGAVPSRPTQNASARASEDAVVVRVPRAEFDQVLIANGAMREHFERATQRAEVHEFLRLATPFGSLPVPQTLTLAGQFEERPFAAGQTVVARGAASDHLFVVRRGEVHAGGSVLREGEHFGEQSLLNQEPASYDFVAAAETRCLALPRDAFEQLLRKVPQVRELLARPSVNGTAAVPADAAAPTSSATPAITPPTTPKPPEPPAGPPKQKLRIPGFWKKFPWIEQHDERDCGAACLAMVARYYNIRLSVGRLRETANVGKEGATMLNIAMAGETLGFNCRGVQTAYAQLASLNLPAIAHWEGRHYVVLYEVKGDRVVVGDPGVGLLRMSRAEFERGWTGRLLLLTPTPRLEQNEPATTTWGRFLPYLRPFYGILFEVFLASLVLEVLQLASPIFTQMIVDKVLVHSNTSMLNLMLVGMLIIGVFQVITTALRQYLLLHLWQKLNLSFTADLFRHILTLPMGFFQTRKIGDFIARFQDNHTIRDMLTGKAIKTILDAMMIVTTLSLMLYYNVQLTVVSLVALPFYVGITLIFTPLLQRNYRREFERQAAAESTLIESIQSISAVKDSTAELNTRWKYEGQIVQHAKLEFRGQALDMQMEAASQSVGLLAGAFMLWYGAHLVIRHELTVGQLMAFQTLVGMVSAPVMGFVSLWNELQQAMLSLRRLNDLHEAKPEQDQSAAAVPLPPLQGHLRIENLSFRYSPDDKDVLKGINLEVQPGQTVAIVGRSGSGKTTLAMLLQRFYRPTEGKILVDGFDLATVDLKTYRTQVGVVAQGSTIFSGTIRENIALGDPDATVERIVEAARAANAHDFITAFPMAYNTPIGETGIGLSGGQKQRLCIARAILKEPRLLIFDEATSALDTESERAIQRKLKTLLQGRTAFVIAHRLSTIQDADMILVLDEGRLIEKGTHRELMALKGLYYYLASQQLGE